MYLKVNYLRNPLEITLLNPLNHSTICIMNRVHNFSAGPAILPLEVLQKAQADLVDYQGTGTSIMEKSHRGVDYTPSS